MVSRYAIGKGEVELLDFTLRFEARWEMEPSDEGSLVCCGFDRLEKIEIVPDGDTPQQVPCPQFASLDGWMISSLADEALERSQEDAERNANEME